jgi:hypothetical protein
MQYAHIGMSLYIGKVRSILQAHLTSSKYGNKHLRSNAQYFMVFIVVFARLKDSLDVA